MRIYYPTNLNESLEEVNFGIVTVGESKRHELVMENEQSGVELHNIKIWSESQEVKVVSYPQFMEQSSRGTLILEYAPDMILEKGLLSTLRFSADKVCG